LHPCRMRTAFPFTSLAGTTGNDACIERQVSQGRARLRLYASRDRVSFR
jgi:hypothetical protein